MKRATLSKRLSSLDRRRSILQAAADVFFDSGFAAASIDMIIDRIGGSKRTIYSEFGSKEGLFIALVTELADGALAPFERDEANESMDVRSALVILAVNLLVIYTSKPLVGIYRAVVTEAHRFPKLARSLYERGPGRAASDIKTVLAAAQVRGELRDIDIAAAADHLVGMMRDNLHLQIVLGLRRPPRRAELTQRAEAAVDLFLNGILAAGRNRRTAV